MVFIKPQDQLTEEEINKPGDVRTAEVLPMFQWTLDAPSCNQDKKIQVLDLKLWVVEFPREGGGPGTVSTTHYEFFRKGMAIG